MDYITSQSYTFEGLINEIKDIKNTIKSYTSNNKKLESMSDQINYIYNFINYDFNSPTSSNNNVLKEINIFKKNQEKMTENLKIISNEIKKTNMNVSELKLNHTTSINSTTNVSDSINYSKIKRYSSVVCDTNEYNLNSNEDFNNKNIKQIYNILSSNFN